MRWKNPFWNAIRNMQDSLALAGTLALSFSLWILWGLFWFPVIDWVFAHI